jgi:hypothetical protein
MEDSSLLGKDLSATRPHTEYTVYDEVAIGLRRLTGASSYEPVLVAQQFVFRMVGIVGLFLVAAGFGLGTLPALIVSGWCSLGIVIAGPAVLAIEYEPTPRAYATGAALLVLGLVIHEKWMLACLVAGIGLLYHPPTVLPIWVLLLVWLLWKRQYRGVLVLAGGVLALLIAAHFQIGRVPGLPLFGRLDPEVEKLQRVRAAYSYVSLWGWQLIAMYIFLSIVAGAALYRLKQRRGLFFLAGLLLLGLASIPVSYILLEGFRWSLIPRLQPARTVLFIAVAAVVLASIAGVRARGAAESAAWLFLVFLAPQHAFGFRNFLVAAGLAIASAVLLKMKQIPAAAVLAVGSFFLLPWLGQVKNYPSVGGPPLEALAGFARGHTSQDAVFLFPDAGKLLYPGMFRAKAKRCVYVDWKLGGQVNYFPALALEWWKRWRETMVNGFDGRGPDAYRALGVDYIVLRPGKAAPGWNPVYSNAEYVLYSAAPN